MSRTRALGVAAPLAFDWMRRLRSVEAFLGAAERRCALGITADAVAAGAAALLG